METKQAIEPPSPYRKYQGDKDESSALCLEWTTLQETYCVRGIESITSHFLSFCRDRRFIDHCQALGFKDPCFALNPHLDNGWGGFKKFATCLDRELSVADHTHPAQSFSKVLSSRRLGLVFHGTQQKNVTSILQTGLNTELRKGQVYGPGEYFATTPTTAVGYCRGGKQIVVFVVILPEPNNGDNVSGKMPFSIGKPAEVVVVNHNEHHLAIGTLFFQDIDKSVLAKSEAKRKAFLKLSHEAMAQERIKKEAETKALIMKHLIANRIDFASEIYVRNGGLLGYLSKREIAWYANSKLDKDVIEAYFPSLPEAIESSKLEEVKILSADEAERNVHETVTKLEQAKQEYLGGLGLEGRVVN